MREHARLCTHTREAILEGRGKNGQTNAYFTTNIYILGGNWAGTVGRKTTRIRIKATCFFMMTCTTKDYLMVSKHTPHILHKSSFESVAIISFRRKYFTKRNLQKKQKLLFLGKYLNCKGKMFEWSSKTSSVASNYLYTLARTFCFVWHYCMMSLVMLWKNNSNRQHIWQVCY